MYDSLFYNNGNLISLTKENHQILSEAKQSRIELGGANIHKIQSDAIPATFLGGWQYKISSTMLSKNITWLLVCCERKQLLWRSLVDH